MSFTQSGVIPLCGTGAFVSCAVGISAQPGMGPSAVATAATLLGGMACTVVPPRKARPTSTRINQRSDRFHMASNIVVARANGNTGERSRKPLHSLPVRGPSPRSLRVRADRRHSPTSEYTYARR